MQTLVPFWLVATCAAVLGCQGSVTTLGDAGSTSGGSSAGGSGAAGGNGASSSSSSGAGGASSSSSGTGGAPLPPYACHDDLDCKDEGLDYYCFPPGTTPGCGICMAPETPCSGDADCKAIDDLLICVADFTNCFCSPGCVPGCTTDGDCTLGQLCDASHRCQPSPCATNADCPIDFACSGDGHCQRKMCKADPECAGYCVQQECYEALGMCSEPAA